MAVNKTFTDNFSIIQIAATLLVVLDVIFTTSFTAVKADSLCAALIGPLGYACDDYTVETPDGFLLGMYNIPYGSAGPGASKGLPVLLFHGFSGGGDNWALNSADESLAPILADLGYDVWIGNNRNIRWSNGNTQYGYSDEEYWDWTWDELAKYDVLSSIDFVYSQRGNTPIYYVCHSQGCMTFLAALSGGPSLRAQAEGKIRSAVLLAPFAYVGHPSAPLANILFSNYADTLLPLLGIGGVDSQSLVEIVCTQFQMTCYDLLDSFIGQDSYINDTRTSFYLKFFPQVTSSKNYNHYGQCYRSQLFQSYDKGSVANMLSYGQLSPPLYDLSSFPTSFPVQIFFGGVDGLADPTDSQLTLSGLPSGLNKEIHNIPDYGHLDFIIGYQAHVDVYPLVASFLSTH